LDYLAACCVFKSESRYLREWVEYHRLVGVARFYMVSNDDDPAPARAILAPYIASGEVFFSHRPGGPFARLQPEIYLDVVEAADGRTRWLGFLDVDEFLLPVHAASVPEVLAAYEQQGALAVNWACFGSSGLQEPPALQSKAFRKRLPDHHEDNRIFKSIVNPSRVAASLNPHRFVLAADEPLRDEFGAPVEHIWRSGNDPFFGERLRINHYRVRSAREYAEKLERWRGADHPELSDPALARQYWRRSEEGEVVDDTIQRFVPELERRLAGAGAAR